MRDTRLRPILLLLTVASLSVRTQADCVPEDGQDQHRKSELETEARRILWGGECGRVPVWEAAQDNLTGMSPENQKLFADIVNVPAHVTIVRHDMPNEDKVVRCAGIIINNRQVLTAASCIRSEGQQEPNRKPTKITVYPGVTACATEGQFGRLGMAATSVCASRRFFAPTNIVTHDVAILQLQWFLSDGFDTFRACLRGPNEDCHPDPDRTLNLVRTGEVFDGSICAHKLDEVKRVDCPDLFKHKTTFCAKMMDEASELTGEGILGAPIVDIASFNPNKTYHATGFVSRVDTSNRLLLVSDLSKLKDEIMELSDECNYDNEVD